MASSPRYVIIDQTNSFFNYTPGWTTVDGTIFDPRGDYGGAYGGSMLQASPNTRLGFTVIYQGSAGRITGTINIGGQLPVWKCTVDDQDIPPQDTTAFASSVISNFDFCAWGPGGDLTTPSGRNTPNGVNITEGVHTVTVAVTSRGDAFAFDRFMYVPSILGTGEVTLELGIWDSAVEYSAGWQDLTGMGRMTATKAAVRVRFYGTGISWIGSTPLDQPTTAGRAQWQMDGGEQNNFTVPASSGRTSRNTVFFETTVMPIGHHTLIVTNLGLTAVMPLVLTRLWIHGGVVPEPVRPVGVDNGGDFTSTTIQSPPATSTPTPSDKPNLNLTNGSSSSEVPIGPIVGGVVGGLALILAVVFTFLWIRRKTRVVKPNHVESQQIEPFKSRPSAQSRPSGVQSAVSDDDTATQRTVVVSVSSEKKRKKKKVLTEKQRLKMRNQTDASSIATTEAMSVKDKASVTMKEVIPVPVRLAPNRRQDETPPLPLSMPSIPEQQTYSSTKGFGVETSRPRTPMTAPDPHPSNPEERHISSSTYSTPPSTVDGTIGASVSTVGPLFQPNRRPVTGALPQQQPTTESRPLITDSKQRARTPSPPAMERHASVSTYSRPPSSIYNPLTGMRSLWRSNRRTTNSEATNGEDEQKHASVSTYHHPPSDMGGHEDRGMIVASGSRVPIGENRQNRRDTVNTAISGTPTLVEESLPESSHAANTANSSGAMTPLRPVRHPILESTIHGNTPTSPGISSAGLSKQEEVAREAEAVANFTSRFRSRYRTGGSSSSGATGDRNKRKKHKDAGVVLVPPVFTGSSSSPRALESPPGYSPPPT